MEVVVLVLMSHTVKRQKKQATKSFIKGTEGLYLHLLLRAALEIVVFVLLVQTAHLSHTDKQLQRKFQSKPKHQSTTF